MTVHPFIEAEKRGGHSVKRACELLQVSRAAFYARRTGRPGSRAVRDVELTEKITAVHAHSRGTYGAPRIHNLRLASTVRMNKTGYLHSSGSRTDSPGIRRDVIQRTDHTEEHCYGSAATGGFAATDIAARVDATGGDVTAAIHQWLTETGRIDPAAHITHLEIRTWRPR